jgi:hypothetical protein
MALSGVGRWRTGASVFAGPGLGPVLWIVDRKAIQQGMVAHSREALNHVQIRRETAKTGFVVKLVVSTTSVTLANSGRPSLTPLAVKDVIIPFISMAVKLIWVTIYFANHFVVESNRHFGSGMF